MEPVGLLHIEEVFIPKEFIESVYREFQETGEEGYERLALFAGNKNGPVFTVTNLIFPTQHLTKGPRGVSFYVNGIELERISGWLYENSCHLIAQVHSHPGEAYHSEADDELAIVTATGGISIVVPDYGNSDTCFSNSAFYRLLPGSGWTEQSQEQIRSLIQIID